MIMFLYIVPLKQGLKLISSISFVSNIIVFIHSSIKTRIETIIPKLFIFGLNWFLYIVPLKQGLKLISVCPTYRPKFLFLYIVPLKQGLKHLLLEEKR